MLYVHNTAYVTVCAIDEMVLQYTYMHKHRNKRRLRVQLAFVYTLMGLAVLSILTILVLVIQGYRYNPFDGKVEQGGLVQFNSRPTGATVTVDDVTLANKTASKVTLTAGAHTITMARDGYSSWKKEVLVKPGSVLWLNYTRLFPNSPKIVTAANFEGVATALPSPNHKLMAVMPKSTNPEIAVTSLNDDTPQTNTIVLPASAYTAPGDDQAQSFGLESWDKNSNLLLIRHGYGDKSEYISLDVRDGRARNITAEMGIEIAKVAYSLGDSNVLYVLTTAHELRRINLPAATVSGVIAANVADFSINEERVITYTTLPDDNGTRTAGYVTQGNLKAKTIATYPLLGDAALRVATGNYYGEHYTVILHGETLDIMRGDLPSSDGTDKLTLTKVAGLKIAGGSDYVGFAPGNNRIVYAARAARMVTYDLELQASATVALQSPLTRDVQWLDTYHILAVGQSGYYYDYDGTNGQLFASNTVDQPATLSENEKYIYYFTATPAGTALQRVKLTND